MVGAGGFPSVAKRRLIVNGDDLGWSRGITEGILFAHSRGVITSATLMVNQPASEYALEQIERAPKLGVGIHLVICDGHPILPPVEVPSLVGADGSFHPADVIKRRLWLGQVSAGEMEAEFRAQIRWMKERGRGPTHADSHQGLHFHPRVVGAFRRALLMEGVGRARGPRLRHWPRDGHAGGPAAGRFYRRLLVSGYRDLLQSVVFRALRCPDCRLAVHPRYQGKPEAWSEALRLALENLPAGTYELECHPGFSEPGFSEKDRWRERREIELRVLTDPEMPALIRRNEIQLINYSEL